MLSLEGYLKESWKCRVIVNDLAPARSQLQVTCKTGEPVRGINCFDNCIR